MNTRFGIRWVQRPCALKMQPDRSRRAARELRFCSFRADFRSFSPNPIRSSAFDIGFFSSSGRSRADRKESEEVRRSIRSPVFASSLAIPPRDRRHIYTGANAIMNSSFRNSFDQRLRRAKTSTPNVSFSLFLLLSPRF